MPPPHEYRSFELASQVNVSSLWGHISGISGDFWAFVFAFLN
jgi:hypothetical protein